MNWTVVTLVQETDVDEAWTQLEVAGANPLFANENPDGSSEIIIAGVSPSFPFIDSTHPYNGPTSIDWELQWQQHGHNYHDGFVHFEAQNIALKLKPGPGFGDLSHPTTHLALDLLLPLAFGKIVLDIGCGSGILSLAAAAAGAKHAYGIDIDPESIHHSIDNAKINHLSNLCTFSQYHAESPDIVVINMIWSEQQEAWKMWANKIHANVLIASGILSSERDTYIEYMNKIGWQLQTVQERDGWLGFIFKQTSA